MFKRIISTMIILSYIFTNLVFQSSLLGFGIAPQSGYIKGTVTIPDVAPAGGVTVNVTQIEEGITTTVTVPEGTKSQPFELNGVTKANSKIKYSISNNEQTYCSNGFYKASGSTYLESEAGYAAINATDISMDLIPAKYTISGKLLFPGNSDWLYDDCKVKIIAMNEGGTYEFSKEVVVRKNDASKEYAIGVPTSEKFSVRYTISEPDSGKFYIYYDSAYYSIGGSVRTKENCTLVEINNPENIRLSILEAQRIISGEVDLPSVEGVLEVAPTGGLNFLVVAKNSANQEFTRLVTIPANENFATFKLGVTEDALYSMKYILQNQTDKYLSVGTYNGQIDVSMGNKDNVVLKVASCDCLIYGNVSLPNGQLAPASGISVEVHAISTMGDFSQSLRIPAGENSVDYQMGVLVSQSTDFKVSYQIISGGTDYFKTGYLANGLTTDNIGVQTTVQINGDKTGLNLQLVSLPLVTSVEPIEAITVANATALNALVLPQTVTANLSNGTQKSFAATWDAATPPYDKIKGGTYGFKATLTMTEGFLNPLNVKASMNVNVAYPTVASVSAIADIVVANGTALTATGLPTQVNTTLNNGSTKALSVTWDGGTPVYSPTVPQVYAFSGTLTMAEGVTNPLNLKATINVTIGNPFIKGTLNLPLAAPVGGVKVMVTDVADGVSTTVTIPEGSRSVSYELNNLSKANSIIKYSLLNNEQLFCSNGFYNAAATTYLESGAVLAALNSSNINMDIMLAKYTITGKLMFTNNEAWQYDDCKVLMVARNQAGTSEFSKELVIKKFDASVDYAIGVPTNERFSVQYVILEPDSSKYFVYLDNAYYSVGGSVRARENCTYVDMNNSVDIRFSILEAQRFISGEVELPSVEGVDEVAPVGGFVLKMVAKNSRNEEFTRLVTIPENQNFATFRVGVTSDNAYSIKYILLSESDKYLSDMSYNGVIDVTNGDRNNLVLKVITSECLISGNASLLAGEVAPVTGISLEVHAVNALGDFLDTVIIPAGLSSVNYQVGVLVGQSKNFKISYKILSGAPTYYPMGYYANGVTTEKIAAQTSVLVNTDRAGLDLQLVIKPVVKTVDAIGNIHVAYGTALINLNLPANVTATLNNGTNKSFAVTWNGGTPPYMATTARTYVFQGTLTMTDDVINPTTVKATINVEVDNPTVSSVAAIANKNVANGTTHGAIGLPANVVATLNDGSTKTLGLTWDSGTPEYAPTTPGTYEFKATLTLADGLTNPSNIKATVNVVVANPIVASVANIADIKVPKGIEIDALGLPANVDVTLNNGTVQNLAVIWNTGEPLYDKTITGVYTFTGNLVLSQGTTNPDNKTATLSVIVDNPTLTSVDALNPIQVINGTASNAALPTTVMATLNNGGRKAFTVRWNGGTPAYDRNTADSYTFAGTLTMVDGITNITNLMASVTLVVNAPKILGVEDIADVVVENGTEWNTLVFPEFVMATLDNGTDKSFEVTWNGGSPVYEKTTAQTSLYIGTLTMRDGVLNPNNKKAQMYVVVKGANVTSVAPITNKSVANWTLLSEVGLPTQVTANINNGSTKSFPVTWDFGTPAYDGTTAGTYDFKGTLTMTDGITNTSNVMATVSVTVQSPTVASVRTILDITVGTGTTLGALSLPANVIVTLNNGGSKALAITWNDGTPVYDGTKIGSYAFNGTLVLADGVTNPLNLMGKVTVIVGQPTVASAAVNSDIKVTVGTALDAVLRPTQVTAILNNGGEKTFPVTWDGGTPVYNAAVIGVYTFTGTMTMPQDITNPDNVMTKVDVIVGNPTVKTVDAIADKNVPYATVLNAVGLPDKVNGTLINDGTKAFSVIWNSVPAYDASKVGTYTFTGTLTMPDGITNPLNGVATVTVHVINSVAQVTAIAGQTVSYGTALSGVSRPANITATLSDGSTKSFAVIWDGGTPTYQGTTAGTYVFKGTLTMADGVTNPSNFMAVVNVIVSAAPGNSGNGGGGGGGGGGGSFNPPNDNSNKDKDKDKDKDKVKEEEDKNNGKRPAGSGEMDVAVLEAISNKIQNTADVKEALQIAIYTIDGMTSNEKGKSSDLDALYAQIAKDVVDKVNIVSADSKTNQNLQEVTLDETKTKEITDTIERITSTAKDLNAKLDEKNVQEKVQTVLKIQGGQDTDETTLQGVGFKFSSSLLSEAKGKIDTILFQSGFAQVAMAPDAVKVSNAKNIELSVKKADRETLSIQVKNAIGENPVYDLTFLADGKKISSFTKPIEITLPYSLGKNEDPEKITVYYVNDAGTLENVLGKYDAASKTVKFSTTHFSKYMVRNVEGIFSDIEKVTWAKSKIEVLTAKGVLSGQGMGTFNPDANVTRAEFATMLVKAFKLVDETLNNNFEDVEKTQWFYAYVSSAFKLGIIKGTSEKTFAPNAVISRQDMTVMIANVLKLVLKKEMVTTGEYATAFNDNESIGQYAVVPVNTVLKYGIMKGMDTKTFGPTEKATRAQAAVVVYNIYNLK